MNDDASASLPAGWIITTLGQLLSDIQPGFASGAHSSDGVGLPHLRPMNVTRDGLLDRSDLRSIAPELADRPTRRLRRGDVLFNNTNSLELVGKTALFDDADTPAFSNHMTRLRVRDEIADPAFIARLLHSRWRGGEFQRLANNHVSQASISRRVLCDLPIALPPLAEQQRIAGRLDEIEACRAASSTHLHTSKALLERVRGAILTWACSGRLVANEPRQHDVRTWPLVTLADVCLSITDGDHQAPPQTPSGIPFVTISAINDGQLRLDRASRFVPPSYYEALKPTRRPRIGDVLFSVTGSIGIPALVDTEEPFTFQRHIAILRPDTSRILSKYLLYVLGTTDIREQGLAVATGTAQLTIPLGGLRAFEILLPSVPEQRAIVHQLESLLGLGALLQGRVSAAQRRLEQSAQASFVRAFRGELVPTVMQ